MNFKVELNFDINVEVDYKFKFEVNLKLYIYQPKTNTYFRQGQIDINPFPASENACLKKDSLGSRPRDQLHTSQTAIVAHTHRKLTKLGSDWKHELSHSEVDNVKGLVDLFFRNKQRLIDQCNLQKSYFFMTPNDNNQICYHVKKKFNQKLHLTMNCYLEAQGFGELEQSISESRMTISSCIVHAVFIQETGLPVDIYIH